MLRILSVGLHPILLDTRKAVLEQAGHSVTTATSHSTALMQAATQRFDITVICHTVRADQASRLARELIAADPTLRVLYLGEWIAAGVEEVRQQPAFLIELVNGLDPSLNAPQPSARRAGLLQNLRRRLS